MLGIAKIKSIRFKYIQKEFSEVKAPFSILNKS